MFASAQRSLFFFFAASLTSAATINVPAGQPTIQAAISAASSGDDILVSPGTYHERIDFKGKNIWVHSSAGSQATTIDGGAAGPVVTFANSETSAAIIDGFTIQNGGGNPNGLDEGGGVSVEGPSPTIQNNIIQNNKVGYAGGGIGIGGGAPLIINNVIQNNTQTNGIGGGGISTRGGSPTIKGNTISGNSATSFGGGLAFWASSQAIIVNNIITGNHGTDAGGISFVNGGAPTIQQNLITGNTGTGAGGLSGPEGIIVNNTIADNIGPGGSAVGGYFGAGLVFENNILLASAGQNAVQCSGNATATQNNLLYSPGGLAISASCQTTFPTPTNIVKDPLFICSSGANYHLQTGSPAIDAGDGSVPLLTTDLAGSPRVVGAAVDLGAYEFQGPSTLSISPSSLLFPDQIVGTAGAPLAVTVANTGKNRGSFCIQPPPSDFQIASNCGSGLDPSGACSIQVSFSPGTQGLKTSTLTIPSDSANSPASVSLSGTAVNPAPQLSSIAPGTAVVNGPAFTLQLTGSGFVSSSQVQWNGANVPTTYVSSSALTAVVGSSNIAMVGTSLVQIVNPGPGGGATSTQSFAVVGPAVSTGGLVNGANFSPQVSAGSFAALFGSNLASGMASNNALPLPTTLGSVSVLMNGYATPLFFVSPSQINLQVPWELASTTDVQIIVTTNGVSAAPVNAQLIPQAPGLISINSQGSGQGAILVAGTSQVASTTRPVNRTEAIEIYCVGLGAVSNPPGSGYPASLSTLSRTVADASVEIGGVPGTVLFAGLAPGLVGVYQVDVQLPLNAPTGPSVPLVLTIAGVMSNTVTIAVQ